MEVHVVTNLELDNELLDEARRLGGHATKRAAVEAALTEYVARRKRRTARELFGTVEWATEYDYKAERERAP